MLLFYLNVSLIVESRAGKLIFFANSLAEDDALLEEEYMQFFCLIIAGHLRHHQWLLHEQLSLRRYVALDTTDTLTYLYTLTIYSYIQFFKRMES